MKLTYNNQTIDFFNFKLPNKVIISLSGGCDSTAVAYLTCKYFPQIEIVPYTARDENAPKDAESAQSIVNWLREEFPNVKIYDHQIFNFNDRTEDYVSYSSCDYEIENNDRYSGLNRVQMSKIIQLRQMSDKMISEHPEAYKLDGMTQNPPYKAMTRLGFYNKAERRRDAVNTYPEFYKGINSYVYQPFVNVNKKFVAGFYKENKLMDTLFRLTRSCVGNARETNNFTQECHNCFWCWEKKWAFDLKWSDSVIDVLGRYRYAREYDESYQISNSMLNSFLEQAWKVTPSKNNFMPYKVHVLGPEHKHLKEIIYDKCTKNERDRGDHKKVKESQDNRKRDPNFTNILSCSHLLFFTQRLETELNPFQRVLVSRGLHFEQTDPKRSDIAKINACIEIGMFCNTLAGLCLSEGLDISHTLCFPTEQKVWQETPGFEFVDNRPLLIMTIGKGKVYRQDIMEADGWLDKDPKPDFRKIVKFLSK